MSRASKFSLEALGLKRDSAKDYRWADEKKVDYHKNIRGYELSKKSKQGKGNGYFKVQGMVLMERSKDKADEEAKENAERIRDRRSAVNSMLDNDIERLSSKHGHNLHEYVEDEGSSK